MKVKCVKIINKRTKECETESQWLTIGKEYVVLELETCDSKDTLYRLVGDNENKMPALYDSLQFEIVSGKMAKNWEASQVDPGYLVLGPKAWQEPGFWEKCYDHDPESLEIYKREARIIMEEEGEL